MGDESWRTINAVRTTIRIIRTLQEEDGASISTIASRLDLASSTVHAHLKTLEQEQVVAQYGDRYVPGLELLNVGGHVAANRREYPIAAQKVTELAAETGERSQFVVEEHGRGYYLATDSGEQAVQMDARIGKKRYLHASSAGKAILAALPDERVDEIIARWGLPALTENTITEADELHEELARIAERGYAINYEESVRGLRAVGVSVQDTDGRVVGAFSISGPSSRLYDERIESDLSTFLQGVTNEMELTLQHA